jgi:SAM-dependent methyltransferase
VIEIWRPNIGSGDDSQHAYDGIYSAQGINNHGDSFYVWLLSLLRPIPRRQLLDVSCGEGALVRCAGNLGLCAHGTDFSFAAVARARRVTGGVNFAHSDGTALPFPRGAFDYVTCIGSLEHFVDPEGGMREIARVLGSHGEACIFVPNTYSLLGNVNYVRKHGHVFDDGFQPIQRYNTRVGWQQMLERSGLCVRRVAKWEITRPRTSSDRLWYLRRPRKIAHLLASFLIPVNLADSLVFICAKA